MTDLRQLAQRILAEHGLAGSLDALSGDRWVFRGERAGKGVVATLEGEPDEQLLRDAAGEIAKALGEERIGR